MISIKSEKKCIIYGSHSSWDFEKTTDELGTETLVKLEIQGDDKGYILIMEPVGFFAADYYFHTLEEAKSVAKEIFSVAEKDWN